MKKSFEERFPYRVTDGTCVIHTCKLKRKANELLTLTTVDGIPCGECGFYVERYGQDGWAPLLPLPELKCDSVSAITKHQHFMTVNPGHETKKSK
jgi:hypothetical protein